MVSTQTNPVRLNQFLALLKGVKSRTAASAIALLGDLRKPDLMIGIARSYRPINDDDPAEPSQSKNIQVRADKTLLSLRDLMTRLFDVQAAVDWTNCEARADVVVDGQTLVRNAPVPYLLFLEKQLGECRQFIAALPTLDPAHRWTWSDEADAWATPEVQTTRAAKVMRNHEISPATDKHPAQVTVYQEDKVVGYWNTTNYSGAVPAARKSLLLERVQELLDAVKFAREQANMAEIVDPKPGSQLFAWLLRH